MFHISQLHHSSRLSPHPLILDLLSTCPTASSILGSKLISSPSLFVLSLCASLSRTELTDHRPARVLEVFGDVNFGSVRQIKPTQLALGRTINVYLLTFLLTSVVSVVMWCLCTDIQHGVGAHLILPQ